MKTGAAIQSGRRFPWDRLRPFLLGFVHGCLIAACVFFKIFADDEDATYQYVAARLDRAGADEEGRALAILSGCKKLIDDRLEVFGGKPRTTLRERLLDSSDVHLQQHYGACGTASAVLARVLRAAGISARMAQAVDGRTGGASHVFVEAQIGGRWVVLDGLFAMAFRNRDGSLASVEELRADWAWFAGQLPRGYPDVGGFAQVRRTNWDKIPVLMPALRAVLGWMDPAGAEGFSLRTNVLNRYRILLWCFGVLYLAVFMFTLWRFVRQSEIEMSP